MRRPPTTCGATRLPRALTLGRSLTLTLSLSLTFTRYDAPTNMRAFFGPGALRRLRLVWMVREPVGKFWSYFWDLKSYGGEWDRVSFAGFVAPKLAKARACLQKDASSPLWPPSLPPPFRDCAPHLDHGLYWPQLQRWLEVFEPA